MNIELQRKLDRILGGVICRGLSLFHLRRRVPAAPAKVDKILIILLSEMGSLVLAYPMFRRIRKLHPNASIHVLLFKKNREMLEILNVVSQQHILTIDNTSMGRFTRDTFAVLRQMRKAKFDAVIDCELFARIGSILSFLSGAEIRVGFHPHTQEGLYRGSFINRPVLYNPYQHISQQFITLVEAIDSAAVPKAKRPVTREQLQVPTVEFDLNEIEEMTQRLRICAPDIAGKKLVLIYPSGGSLPIRAWPLEYYCRLSGRLLREGYALGIIGMEDDKGIAEKIQSYCQSPGCVDLTGHTRNIRELMILFNIASLLITNDGGPGQFSAMTPIPTIVFFGPETPTLYASLDHKATIFFSSLSCSPCITAYNHRKSPCDGDNICLKHIQPDEVLTKALEILRADEGVQPVELPAPAPTRRPDRIVAIEKKGTPTQREPV
jgi:ADP-heptose:LPS heptosyltransferase